MRGLGLIVVLLVSTSAIADDSLPPWAEGVSADDRRAASEAFARGNADFERARYAVALTAYEQALARWENPQIRYNSAVCLMHLDRPLEAYRNIERALAFGQAPFERELYEQAQLHRKLLLAQLSRLVVKVSPANATVTVNGVATTAGQTTMGLPGSVLVVATLPGHDTMTRRVELSGGTKRTVELRLARTEAVTITRRYPQWVPWTVGGVAIATLSGSIAFHLRSRSRFDDYDDALLAACPTGCTGDDVPAEVRSLEDDGKRARIVATTGYALTAALAVAGVTLAVLNRERAVSSPMVGVAPTSRGVGLVVRAEF